MNDTYNASVINFTNANPALESERMWSYQVGIETVATKYARLKIELFYHDIDKVWKFDRANAYYINRGSSKRTGYEVELNTIPIHGISLSANFSYTNDDPSEAKSDDFYSINLQLDYDCPGGFKAQLFGHYMWWMAETTYQGQYGTFIWDLNLRQPVSIGDKADFDLFFTAHNLFNGSQYWSIQYPNPERWVEAGLIFRF